AHGRANDMEGIAKRLACRAPRMVDMWMSMQLQGRQVFAHEARTRDRRDAEATKESSRPTMTMPSRTEMNQSESGHDGAGVSSASLGMGETSAEERAALVEAVRDFADARLAPFANQRDADHEFPVETLREAGQLGLGAICVREDVGGSGLSRLDAIAIYEELARGDIAVATYISIHNMVVGMIDAEGTDEQRRRWLPQLTDMTELASYCLTEPGAGSDAAAVATMAVRDGDDYVLTGTKQFISGAGTSA